MQPNSNQGKSSSRSEKKPYIRKISVNDKDVEFVVKEAVFAKLLDEEMLLDKVTINFMLDEIASAIKNNLSKNNPIPNTVILSQENSNTLLNDPSQNPSAVIPCTNNIPKSNKIIENNIIKSAPIIESEKSQSVSNIDPQTKTDVKENDSTVDDSIKKAMAESDFLKVYPPKYTFDDVYVDPISKRRIVSTLILAKEKNKLYNEWGLLSTLKNPRPLILNFYGPPGTGKSMMAEAIASHLKKNVFLVNYSELESSTPGETPKKIVQCFNKAKEESAVLIFDEADSFLGKRLTNVTSAADYSINITRSVMLIELEKFDGIVVFTTNFIGNYDIAFKRRIFASLEFRLPDEKGRAHIWNSHIPKQLPLSHGITPLALAYKYGGTTGADIKDIVLFAALNCLEKGRERLTWDDFDEAHYTVKNRYDVG
jgi:SpoVK/Ycf46/Vps4 family AAA+-type ATPase